MFGKIFSRNYSCSDTLEHLQSYLDGETDSKTARKVAAHLADCPNCTDELSLYQQIKVSLRAPKVEVDPQVLQALNDFGRRVAQSDAQS